MIDGDDPFRDHLRPQRRESYADASAALDALRPKMRRARVNHLAVRGAMVTAVAVIGGGALLTLRQDPAVTTIRATDIDSTLDSSFEPTTTLRPTEPPAPAPPVETTAPPESDDESDDVRPTVPPATSDRARPDDDEPTPTPTPTNAPPSSPAPTTPPAPVVESTPTTAPAISAPAPSTTATRRPATTPPRPPAPGDDTIESTCGSITVAVEGDEVTLTSTTPGPGFSVDVKNEGPEEVEVGFAGGDEECELRARVEDGTLVTDVDDH
jgi:outer membrane biosynthesis protein TonB